jgi:glycosyltransferase involved in cell wall biosynthesis
VSEAAPLPVVFVSSHAKSGGSELYLEALVEHLGPGWSRAVVVLDDGPFVDRLRARGTAVEVVPTGRRMGIVSGAVGLRRTLRRLDPAVVHANGVKAALVAVLAAAGTPWPVVWFKHDFSRDGWFGRTVARRCRLVVGVSETVVAAVRSAATTRVVPTGLAVAPVDRDKARRHVLELLGAASGAEVVTLVGRMDPGKGHRELLAALPAIRAARPQTRVAFLGGDDSAHPHYPAAVREEVSRLGAGEAVTFLGHRDDALTIIAGSDVVVVPSVPVDRRGMGREGFGLVGVEAMATGTPVVGYADGALPEVLGPCALLVPPRDRVALGQAVVELLSDRTATARLVACGRRRVAERFSPERMTEAIKGCYLEAASPRP